MSLWAFACETYARPDVRERLLRLQDDHGQCVDLLLWRLWLSAAGRDPADLEAAVSMARAVEQELLAPLRAVRRRLRGGPQPLPAEARSALHAQVGACELAAERTLLEALEALASAPAPGRDAAAALAATAAAWGAAAPAALLAELTAAC